MTNRLLLFLPHMHTSSCPSRHAHHCLKWRLQEVTLCQFVCWEVSKLHPATKTGKHLEMGRRDSERGGGGEGETARGGTKVRREGRGGGREGRGGGRGGGREGGGREGGGREIGGK